MRNEILFVMEENCRGATTEKGDLSKWIDRAMKQIGDGREAQTAKARIDTQVRESDGEEGKRMKR